MKVFLLIMQNSHNLASEVIGAYADLDRARSDRLACIKKNPDYFFEIQEMNVV
jgi:hypothetical protein